MVRQPWRSVSPPRQYPKHWCDINSLLTTSAKNRTIWALGGEMSSISDRPCPKFYLRILYICFLTWCLGKELWLLKLLILKDYLRKFLLYHIVILRLNKTVFCLHPFTIKGLVEAFAKWNVATSSFVQLNTHLSRGILFSYGSQVVKKRYIFSSIDYLTFKDDFPDGFCMSFSI